MLEWNLGFHLELAAHLHEAHGWDFVYWVGDGPVFGRAVEERFPGIVFHDTVDARFGRPPRALADLVPRVFDEGLAHALAYHETLALKMMDRIDVQESFGYHERARLYQRLVGWWVALLDRIDPDVLVAPTPPHVHYDYLAYALCRLRGVRTAMFENGSIPGLLLPVRRFEDGFPEVASAARRLRDDDDGTSEVELGVKTAETLARARGGYVVPHHWAPFRSDEPPALEDPSEPGRLGRMLSRLAGSPGLHALAERAARHRIPLARRLAAAGRRPPSQPVPGARPISGFYHGRFVAAGEATAEEDARHALWVRERMLELRRAYDRVAAPVDLSASYVYLPLHVQPERSTSPNGGIYDHTELLIETVARSLPPGWLLYVKEHPSQLAPWQTGERGRRLGDYARFAAIPGVRLVPLDTKPFDLIDRARAVATVTGTSGWEAIARGVPVLCFGIAWYQGCDGVFDVRRSEDLTAAIESIAAGARPTPRGVALFLKAVESVAIRAFIDEAEREVAQVSDEENVRALSRALVRMVTEEGGEPTAG